MLRVAELIRLSEPEARASLQPLPRRITVVTAELVSGTLVTLEVRRSWWDRRRRARVVDRLQRVMDRARAKERTFVVAAAIRSNGRVLLAQRDHPEQLAGLWEFPGGKVERGESLPAALSRECLEELGVVVTVGREVGRSVLTDGAVLVLFDCRLAPGSGDAVALEHRALRWVNSVELENAELIPTNREFLPKIVHLA